MFGRPLTRITLFCIGLAAQAFQELQWTEEHTPEEDIENGALAKPIHFTPPRNLRGDPMVRFPSDVACVNHDKEHGVTRQTVHDVAVWSNYNRSIIVQVLSKNINPRTIVLDN